MSAELLRGAVDRIDSPLPAAITTAVELPASTVPLFQQPSLEALFRTYHTELCAFARRYVRCPDVAEELVSDVFVRVWELRETWPAVCASQKRYLYTAVRNGALKHLAHERVVQRSRAMTQEPGPVPGMSQAPAAPDDELQAMELALAFENAIDRLPRRCRQAYALHREHGMSYAQIASVMGISVRTVETQLARANRILRRELAPWLS